MADEQAAEGAHVFNAAGGDWDDLVDEAAALDEERIVVNMGPQHPSTHGVLRLILEIDGETVTEARAGIGYLHTGIEKNMEYRNWTQGVTFCTRMDYLTPMFQEAAYCLGIEKLLGITDQIPERASIIRVLHDGAHPDQLATSSASATGGMEMGATTVMTVGFRERERILAHHRDDHRPADEQRLHPPRRRGPGPAARRDRHDPRHGPRRCAAACGELEAAAQREPHPQGPHRRRRLPRPDRLHGARASPARCCARPACRTTCASSTPYCGYETYDFEVTDPRRPATPTAACGSASTRCTSR